MSTPDESMAGHEVTQAEHVLEGELVDDLPTPRAGQVRGPAPWWTWVTDRRRATNAAKDLLLWLVRAPGRFLGAMLRGLIAGFRLWRRWVTVREYRDAVVAAEKLASKFVEIRALSLFRWKVTGVVVVVVVIGMALVDLVYGSQWMWSGVLVLCVVLAMVGRRREGAPGRKAVLAGPRILTWATDPQVFVDAFRDAKLIGKDETLRLVERLSRAGAGWALTVDLPSARTATDVIKNREALASALAVDEVQLIVERVRGNAGHAGRVALWVADADPYATPLLRTPLLEERQWDAWRPVPFGRDARDRRLELPLVWTSLLIGAIPRQGKTFAARLATTGLVLDPHTRLYIADFKAGKDWHAASQVAHRYLSGDEPADVLRLVDWLVGLVAEVQARFRRMRELDDLTCPESKVTPAMSRDRGLDMPITAIVIDEAQVPLEDRTPVEVKGRTLTAGEYVGELLTWLAKKAPAAGIVLILATQRPDARTIPSSLRAVLGSRFALRVMDWRDSNIVLGDQMNARGYDSSRLLAAHKGVGILRPDGDMPASADVVAVTVRTYYMPNEDWNTICQRGRALRQAAGTLTGHATGDAPAPTSDYAVTVPVVDTVVPEPRQASEAVPEPLASVVEHLENLGESAPEFISVSDLAEALDLEPRLLGRQLAELGYRSTRERTTDESGDIRQIRGYLTVDLLDAAATENLEPPDGDL
jgi:S-DNA-T family DNA segregation ATPase FtsK/SpoIIIE